MYRTPELIKNISLSEIEIPNQEKIEAATGSKLDLENAYKVIEEVSENFSQYDEKAIEADKLLSELIERHLKKTAIEEKQEELPLEVSEKHKNEKASASRKRKLRLMKIKLGIKSKEKVKLKK